MKQLFFLFLALFAGVQSSRSQETEDQYDLAIGGAVRMNYLYKSWDESQNKTGGEIAYDMIRFDIDANYNNVITSAQIRFYRPDFGGILIHHAYMGYKFEHSEIHIGIDQVPFGIQTYASNNWFFNINYYVGLEDDYDLGVQYIYKKNKLGLKAAFFKNSEMPADNFSRYSYDITGTHSEVNQLNLKATYDFKKLEIGLSTQIGQLEETATGDLGKQSAYAVHAHGQMGPFDYKLQGTYFKIDPKGSEKEIVYMSAYGAEYAVTTEALVLTAGLLYSWPIDAGPLKSLDFYNDFGIIGKQISGQTNSLINVLGVGVNMGKMYTYVDWALGKNHSWLGPLWTDAFGAGDPEASWHARFNINFGYYF
ncbi:hypothetical protein N7E81_03885 [Reichenbachiella carrageenanivorans]|uniref:Phosphate-selective porin O and P n=1 Tax=Reichenbachiella carrageenanivorans TaxID=2979869 RepID=A0ABY6D395_9BACT|nr:hypothetical protein [Reichenbachiella carrageenanivorans]UXX80239.1 hypothetical protein N7E81_03885 [Reichenbachiella carrageenanivorans]